MSADKIRLEALQLQMRTGYRYIECLWCVTEFYEEQFIAIHDEPEWFLPFWTEVAQDWTAYVRRMREAGYPYYNLAKYRPQDVTPVSGFLKAT